MSEPWYSGLIDFDGERLEKKGIHWRGFNYEYGNRRFFPKEFQKKMQIDFEGMKEPLDLTTGLPGSIIFKRMMLGWNNWVLYLENDAKSISTWLSRFRNPFHPFRDNPFETSDDELVFLSLIPDYAVKYVPGRY